MDSWEWNKIIGAVLGTLLFIMVVRIATGAIFEHPEMAKPGYEVAGVTTEQKATSQPAEPKEEPLPDFGTVLASADVAKGENIAHRCQQCHDLTKGGPNKIGPNLWNVVGSPRGEGRGGYDFSAAMKAKGGNWTYAELFRFLKQPQAYIPGTKMTFAGLRSENDRIDLIAYLRTLSDNPAPLPPPEAKK